MESINIVKNKFFGRCLCGTKNETSRAKKIYLSNGNKLFFTRCSGCGNYTEVTKIIVELKTEKFNFDTIRIDFNDCETIKIPNAKNVTITFEERM